jgi:cytochrome c556
MQPRRLTLVFLMACGLPALSQEYPEFAAWMKAQDTASKALNKLEKKTGAEAVKEAEKLSVVYENMIAFWRGRNVADAVKWSEEGKAAAVILASAANSGDAEKSAAAFKTVNGTCRSCHNAHREKVGEGKYRIK